MKQKNWSKKHREKSSFELQRNDKAIENKLLDDIDYSDAAR